MGWSKGNQIKNNELSNMLWFIFFHKRDNGTMYSQYDDVIKMTFKYSHWGGCLQYPGCGGHKH